MGELLWLASSRTVQKTLYLCLLANLKFKDLFDKRFFDKTWPLEAERQSVRGGGDPTVKQSGKRGGGHLHSSLGVCRGHEVSILYIEVEVGLKSIFAPNDEDENDCWGKARAVG